MQNFANLRRTNFFTFESSAFNRTQPPFPESISDLDSRASASNLRTICRLPAPARKNPDIPEPQQRLCFGHGWLNIIFIDVFLHIFAVNAIFSGDLQFEKGIPPWPKSLQGLK
jgi:hypothetical protein